jgi:hypothetical protein
MRPRFDPPPARPSALQQPYPCDPQPRPPRSPPHTPCRLPGRPLRLLSSDDPLKDCQYIAVAALSGGRGGRNDAAQLAAPLTLAAMREHLSSEIRRRTVVFWAPASKVVLARAQERLGALVLSEQAAEVADEEALPVLFKVRARKPGAQGLRRGRCSMAGGHMGVCLRACAGPSCKWCLARAAFGEPTRPPEPAELQAGPRAPAACPPPEQPRQRTETRPARPKPALSGKALFEGGWASLPVPAAAEAWRHRAAWLRAAEVAAAGASRLPDLSEAALLASLPQWLGPYAAGARGRAQLARLDWAAIFRGMVRGCWEAPYASMAAGCPQHRRLQAPVAPPPQPSGGPQNQPCANRLHQQATRPSLPPPAHPTPPHPTPALEHPSADELGAAATRGVRGAEPRGATNRLQSGH